MATSKKPLALFLDNNVEFLKSAAAKLSQFGMEVAGATNEGDFIAKIGKTRPDCCFVDLNIGAAVGGIEGGFALVRRLREEFSFAGPIFITSALSEAQSIAHALEVGANDFIVKPLDREILASKLATYFTADGLADHKLSYQSAPESGILATVGVEMSVVGIDELGINITGNHLLTKGTMIRISGNLVPQLTGVSDPVTMRIVSTWVNDDGKTYGAYAEFDSSNAALTTAVRRWLTEHTAQISESAQTEKRQS